MTDAKSPVAATTSASERGFDRHMLEALVCPVTHTTLRYDAQRQELISEAAGLAFPIHDGIPIMLIDEARQLKAD
ncbi:Trm112 family protein [Paracoccus aestuariivivens]|uniref:UPF0434 protein GL286_07655 n=1 Tax=Paracoccus aestuariivivens TaxID=1820333 RepID=A0A6L6J7Q3_9RHOB|nr:Trm112 family protein [Paracoccus aestuariivivens]MTH77596.1 Trm112 family protein [Paracoccus aestuariivivens]